MLVDDSRLNLGQAILQVDLQDPIHPGKLQDDAALRGNGAPAQAGAGASGQKGNLVPAGKSDNLKHFLGGVWEDHEIGHAGMEGQPVAFIDQQFFRGVEDPVAAQQVHQFLPDLGPGEARFRSCSYHDVAL